MRSSEIRRNFLKYFEDKGHAVLQGSSLIPKDPTVLLTLAGMLQFKPVFLGLEQARVKRATTVQKCIRTNDIENVGHTARHHTFFEMLGNFSFGDYFKKEAISFAWELLTKEFNIDAKKLFIAVYDKDDESAEIWKKDVGISENRLIRLGEDNNFWAAGPTGPCGPCSEIYYDLGEKFGCGNTACAPGCDCDRFLEIWNLVFMEFNRDGAGKLTPLPKKNIDTGMGLERITSVLQGVSSNFETDLFLPIIDKVCATAKISEWKNNSSVKIIADHARAASFLVSDGLTPGNEGRNYVLRRIIRRAVMHGRKIGIRDFFISGLVDTVNEVMGDFYIGFSKDLNNIKRVIGSEEESFGKTLETGMEILEEVIGRSGGGRISGKDAFKLYDTYGFPVEMTKEIAQDRGFSVDMEGFEQCLNGQKEKSKSSSKKFNLGAVPQIKGYPATEFVGYDLTDCEASVLDVIDNFVVLDKTPFYVESGGQDSDRGWLVVEKNRIEISKLLKTSEGVILHRISGGIIPKKGEKVRAEVNKEIRAMIAAHHTATHLLHAALRKVLGEHVKQSGSFVGSDKFRLDFSSAEALKAEELKQVENMVNDIVRKAINVTTIITTPEEARKLGAMALFDEKYGDKVRMVVIGDISKELCGGTHVRNTSEIGAFKIMKEGAIAQGIRRIEAVSGKNAAEFERRKKEEMEKENAAADLKEKNKKEEKEQEKQAIAKADAVIKTKEGNLIFFEFKQYKSAPLNQLANYINDKGSSNVIVFTSVFPDKVSIICSVSPDLINKGYNAGNIVRELAAVIGGKGGGRPDTAEAGGRDVANKDKIRDKAKEVLARIV